MISIATGYQLQNSTEYLQSLDAVANRYVSITGTVIGGQGVGEEKTAASDGHAHSAATTAGMTTVPTPSVAGTSVGTVELEDEEEWLTGLQSFIAQVTATSSGGAASSSSSSSSSSKGVLPTSSASQQSSASSSSSSNVNNSIATGNGGGTVAGTGTGTEKDKRGDKKGDKKGSDPLPLPPAPATGSGTAASSVEGKSTRRSTRTLAGQQASANPSSAQPKEEVGDFFKNLLLMGTPGQPASQSSTVVDDGNKK